MAGVFWPDQICPDLPKKTVSDISSRETHKFNRPESKRKQNLRNSVRLEFIELLLLHRRRWDTNDEKLLATNVLLKLSFEKVGKIKITTGVLSMAEHEIATPNVKDKSPENVRDFKRVIGRRTTLVLTPNLIHSGVASFELHSPVAPRSSHGAHRQ